MRYLCEHARLGIHKSVEARHEAEDWLREIHSEGATVTDRETGARARILATGHIEWTPKRNPSGTTDAPSGRINIERVREVHGRERQHMWTRNDPDLIPPNIEMSSAAAQTGPVPGIDGFVDELLLRHPECLSRDQTRTVLMAFAAHVRRNSK